MLNFYQYSAFGETVTAEESIPNRLRYNAQTEDELTGLYYLRARYYAPNIGRFTQEDVIYNDGLNLYAYCDSNPVMYCDPSGFAKKVCEPKVGGERGSDTYSNRPLSNLSDDELQSLGYKRYSDGSIRDSLGHFAGNSGTIPGTPGVDIVEAYLENNSYAINGREISVRGADGTLRRYDIVATSPEQIVTGIEVKSGSATRTAQQVKIDDELLDAGGLNTVGQKAIDANINKIVDVEVFHVDSNGIVT